MEARDIKDERGRAMRIGLLHEKELSNPIEECVLQALNRHWPGLERMVFSSAEQFPGVERLASEGWDLVICLGQKGLRSEIAKQSRLILCYLTLSEEPVSFFPALHESPGQKNKAENRWKTFPQDLSVEFIAATESMGMQHSRLVEEVLLPPIETRYFSPGHEVRDSFYLTVCREGANREIESVVEACGEMGRELVVVGSEQFDLPEPVSLREGIRCLGIQPASVHRDLYRRCRALICPFEGEFDPAAVEAQACGTPVLANIGTGASESIVDAEMSRPGTGLVFDDSTDFGLQSAMRELERRPQRFSASLAWVTAARYRSEHFVEQLQNCIQRLLVAQNVWKHGWSASEPSSSEKRAA